jgi:tetratricopeptide (TPR) repeat protein
MSLRIQIIIMLFSVVLLFSFFKVVNDTNVEIRLNELTSYFHDIDIMENNADDIVLVAHYKLNKKLYEEKISRETADAMEHRLQLLSDSRIANIRQEERNTGILKAMSMSLINLNRMLMGKSPIRKIRKKKDPLKLIEEAYYFEKNYAFKKAIEIYRRVLIEGEISRAVTARVLLHLGYSSALMGSYRSAENYYERITREYSRDNIAITASILLKYLRGFEKEKSRVKKSGIGSLDKGEKLFRLQAYDDALSILKAMEIKAAPDQVSRIKYYKAQCYSGIGEPGKAAEIYMGIIATNPGSKFARLSNRSLFLIGNRMGGENRVKRASVKLNRVIKDPILDKMLETEKIYAGDEKNRQMPADKIMVSPEILKKADEVLLVKKNDYAGKSVKVKTRDENVFAGTVIADKNNMFSIRTSIGVIDIHKNKISSIQIVK